MKKKLKQPPASDHFQSLDWVSIEKVNWIGDEQKTSQGVRLYCTQANASWTLQVRAPIKLANGRRGKDYIVASAALSKKELLGLRKEIDRQISNQEGR